MTLIDLGEFKLRFDSKEVRISIDGDLIDIGARTIEQKMTFPEINGCDWANPGLWEIDTMVLSPDGKERTYVNKKTGQRITASEFRAL